MMCKLVTFDVDFCLAYEKLELCGAPSHSYDTPPMTSIEPSMHAYITVTLSYMSAVALHTLQRDTAQMVEPGKNRYRI
jgi:hypothetical protein